jgi:hypothetical protein
VWNLTHVGCGGTGFGSSTGTLSNQQAPSTPNGDHNGSGVASSSSDAYSHLSRLASIDSFDSRWYASLQN